MATKNKSKLYQKETVWLGHTISNDGNGQTKENGEYFKTTRNTKTLKYFLGAIQDYENFIPILSEKTDNLRQKLKKDIKEEWTEKGNTDFHYL